jgi:hypothetical protein
MYTRLFSMGRSESSVQLCDQSCVKCDQDRHSAPSHAHAFVHAKQLALAELAREEFDAT